MPNCYLETDGSLLRPSQGILALTMSQIEFCSRIDLERLEWAVRMTSADHVVVSALFESLPGTKAVNDALINMAKPALPRGDLVRFEAVQRFLQPIFKTRNVFAHQILTKPTDRDELLVTIHPKFLIQRTARRQARLAQIQRSVRRSENPLMWQTSQGEFSEIASFVRSENSEFVDFDPAHALVYARTELEKCVEEAYNGYRFAAGFSASLGEGAISDKMRERLDDALAELS